MSQVQASQVRHGVTSRSAPLSCTCSVEDGGVVLSLVGEVDLSTCALLEGWLEAAQAEGRPVVVDLSGVTFLDSTGLKALVLARRRGQMCVRGEHGMIRTALEITGLDRVLLEERADGPSTGRWRA